MTACKAPKHIQDLALCGKTFADLTNFRRCLEGFRITVCWHHGKREWILGKVPVSGPHHLRLIVGTVALAGLMDDPMDVARQFETMAAAFA